jgi:hypothetical protein
MFGRLSEFLGAAAEQTAVAQEDKPALGISLAERSCRLTTLPFKVDEWFHSALHSLHCYNFGFCSPYTTLPGIYKASLGSKPVLNHFKHRPEFATS